MPLRDHFRPPISKKSSWEGFHGMWPGEMVRSLLPHLPEAYTAEPRVHLGNLYELDVNAYRDDAVAEGAPRTETTDGATLNSTLHVPTLTLEADLTQEYEYEVLIFDQSRNRRLVAAVEIVSPGNKGRPESRWAFVAKCAALLQERVCVSIVDVVTNRKFNLYAELLDKLGRSDPVFASALPPTYAATLRGRNLKGKPYLEIWSHALSAGQALPTLPVWLTEDFLIPLDLEACYEEACRVLRIA